MFLLLKIIDAPSPDWSINSNWSINSEEDWRQTNPRHTGISNCSSMLVFLCYRLGSMQIRVQVAANKGFQLSE